ncbi:MAG: maleylpyruvate isomerase family mycothiol-dependent enzyme [Actinobacteria bacterium]|nr:maleylpyruvate isomerase family mycothiol-dependent enzyme [Actinomycetota bacterium]
MSSSPDFLSALRDSTDELRRLARSTHDTIVPDCPGWSGRDVIVHLGRVYASVTAIVDARATGPLDPGQAANAPEKSAVFDWIDERCDAMLTALSNIAPDEKVWTWSDDHTGRFYRRRMVHETAVHVCDLQRAIAITTTMDRAMACDGIDEAYGVILPPGMRRKARAFPPSTLHLHCTDGPGEWMIIPDGDALDVRHEHSKGDVAWRGSAVALMLAAWGRRHTGVVAFGDPRASEEWSSLGI